MSKAVLVMDMPKSCSVCPCISECEECTAMSISTIDVDIYKARPNWCPLRELPEKANHPDWCDGGRYDKGFNDCIDEILKGNE